MSTPQPETSCGVRAFEALRQALGDPQDPEERVGVRPCAPPFLGTETPRSLGPRVPPPVTGRGSPFPRPLGPFSRPRMQYGGSRLGVVGGPARPGPRLWRPALPSRGRPWPAHLSGARDRAASPPRPPPSSAAGEDPPAPSPPGGSRGFCPRPQTSGEQVPPLAAPPARAPARSALTARSGVRTRRRRHRAEGAPRPAPPHLPATRAPPPGGMGPGPRPAPIAQMGKLRPRRRLALPQGRASSQRKPASGLTVRPPGAAAAPPESPALSLGPAPGRPLGPGAEAPLARSQTTPHPPHPRHGQS
ncbi:basic proline-rich protein-like [Choloepus didactylus]|uniref:basic proline-rich protein-like n=1 Tax=Choloepus didactylus TaxID=27675 RepID=UPI00189F6711|nr:basic proline-rich protein-like [Choloepus didactylus]